MRMIARFLTGAAACAVLASTAFAGGRNPGSVLVYPVHYSGQFATVVSVTNTNLVPENPNSLGGATNVHFEYVNAIYNPYDYFCPLDCIVFDRVEYLTPADTLSVLTAFHNATFVGTGGDMYGSEGYLVVSAEDPYAFDAPWSHNYLVGSELVLNPTGGMYSVNAIAMNAVGDDGVATDADADGQLDFDGIEYEEIPDVLMIDSFLAAAGSSLALINFTGGPKAENTVLFRVWNDNEFPLSATLTFCCWFNQPLYYVNPLFSESFLENNTPHDPTELDITGDGNDDLQTGWATIDSILVLTSGGSVLANDGAMLGSITAGPASFIDGGRLLWESVETQDNGQFVDYRQ